MLLRKNLRGGHQNGPRSRLDREDHCRSRDHGFPGADIPLQESVHPMGLSHVAPNRSDGLLLRLRQGKGKIAKEGIEERARGLLGDSAGFAGLVAPESDECLHAEELPKCQLPARRFEFFGFVREMNLPECRGPVGHALRKRINPSVPVGFITGPMNQPPDDTDADSFAGGMHGDDAVEMDALAILLGDHFELRMLHAEALPAEADLAVNDYARAGDDRLLDMEEIEPAEREARGESRSGRFLNLGLEAAHPSEAAEDGLSDRAAQAEGAVVLGIRKMIEAPSVLVPPGVMLQQVAQGEDAESAERGELGTPDPSESLQWSLGIVGRLRGKWLRFCRLRFG